MLDLRRGEWAAVIAIVGVVVAFNKLVVHDQGNNWGGLLFVSLYLGIVLVHLRRVIARRGRS